MEILNLAQGTPEWLAVRLEKLTASEAPAMMGESKFMSRNELLALKKGWQSNPDSKFKEALYQRGHDCEDAAREIAELELFEELKPIVGSRVVDGLELLASFDGLSDDLLVAWEHKLYNATLAENVRNHLLEPHYYWQLEHQMLVADINEISFNASDGTTDNNVSMMYFSVPERREKIIAGWIQFIIDFDSFELKAKTEAVVANKIAKLPSLQISLVGQVSNSNLATYKNTAIAFIGAIKTELETDQDFKDANEAVKWLGNGEKELEAVKERALSDTADIKALFETIDELKEEMRQKRLKLSKLTKSEKDRIRADISNTAHNDFCNFITKSDEQIFPIKLLSVTSFDSDFLAPMKGKSSVESLQNAVDTKLAKLKIEVGDIVELISLNLASLIELASEYKFLFNDTPQLVLKDNDDLVNLIKTRIAEHETKEEKRLADQREQIRLEEERKAKIVKVLMPSGIREFADLAEAATVAKNANGNLVHNEDGSIEFKANEVKKVSVQKDKAIKCDGNHGGPKCQDPECWNDDKEQTSVDKEVSTTPQEQSHPSNCKGCPDCQGINCEITNQAAKRELTSSASTMLGEYESLDLWPSDYDISESDELARVCQKLEEAEAYIQILTTDKAA